MYIKIECTPWMIHGRDIELDITVEDCGEIFRRKAVVAEDFYVDESIFSRVMENLTHDLQQMIVKHNKKL